jgi:RNase P/RNase MRP subunit p29
MYEPMDCEFFNDQQTSTSTKTLTSNDDREKFVDSLLANYLTDEKMREKSQLRDKLKFKRHQLDTASKQIRKEKKRKNNLEALTSGLNVHASKEAKQLKTKKLILSCKLKKTLRLYKLNKKDKIEYEKYEAMNGLWKTYAASCLLTLISNEENNPNFTELNVLNCLKQIDYHGCHLTVTRSSSKYQIGIAGIVLQDKKNAFFILTKDNKVKIIPKTGCNFQFELFDSIKMTLNGDNMCYRPEMRTTKHVKIKNKKNIII